MKRVIFKNSRGRMECRLIRDEDDPEHPEIGIPVEPPPIESIVRDAAEEIQDFFVINGLLTYQDVVRSQNGVSTALNNLRRKIIEAYKLKELEENGPKL